MYGLTLQTLRILISVPPAETADETQFTTVFSGIVPLCQGEALNSFNGVAPLDGDASSVSTTDINTWFLGISKG
jgi:hypothetical protein